MGEEIEVAAHDLDVALHHRNRQLDTLDVLLDGDGVGHGDREVRGTGRDESRPRRDDQQIGAEAADLPDHHLAGARADGDDEDDCGDADDNAKQREPAAYRIGAQRVESADDGVDISHAAPRTSCSRRAALADASWIWSETSRPSRSCTVRRANAAI